MSGFKTQSKRNRELAKLNKRRVKDEKRALRKAERAGSLVASEPTAAAVAVAAAPKPFPTRLTGLPAPAPAPKPLTLAEAVERWKATKVVKTKHR